MQTFIFPNLPRVPALAAATGFFDGVHRGHCAVIRRLVSGAERLCLPSAAVTYEPHPRRVLADGQDLPLLTAFAEKEELLAAQGIDFLIVIPFTPAFAQMTAAEFVRLYLKEKLAIAHLTLGYNQRIGSDGAGGEDALQKICAPLHIGVAQAPPVLEGSIEISSTKIRRALLEGKIDTANQMLGYQYFMQGRVMRGRQIGRSIGFPTANIGIAPHKLLPMDGAYAVRVRAVGRHWDGMLNVGCNPTLNAAAPRSAEVHLFDFQEDIYGQEVRVHLAGRLRGEQRFASIQALQAALTLDMQRAKAALARQALP